MGDDRKTTDFRYLVAGDNNILFRCNDKEQLERYLQEQPPERIAVFQKRYVSEGVLCSVEYEDETYPEEDKSNEDK